MASTSLTELSLAMEETPNWLELPHELMVTILQRLGAVEILHNAQKVCTTWRRICKDPMMWKVINLHDSIPGREEYVEKLAKEAVNRSCGELIDINIGYLGTDDLLDHISQSSSKLNCLCLLDCSYITSDGLSHALQRLPHLEKLQLVYPFIFAEGIEVIGRNCPKLKSFKMNKEFVDTPNYGDVDALAIANSMPELRHLQLFGNKITNKGLEAILDGCPDLESLDLRRCYNLNLDGDLGKLCRERIKDLKRPTDSTENCGFNLRSEDYDPFDDMYPSGPDLDDFSEEEYDFYDWQDFSPEEYVYQLFD